VLYLHGMEGPRALLHAVEALARVLEDVGRPRRRQQVFLRCDCCVGMEFLWDFLGGASSSSLWLPSSALSIRVAFFMSCS